MNKWIYRGRHTQAPPLEFWNCERRLSEEANARARVDRSDRGPARAIPTSSHRAVILPLARKGSAAIPPPRSLRGSTLGGMACGRRRKRRRNGRQKLRWKRKKYQGTTYRVRPGCDPAAGPQRTTSGYRSAPGSNTSNPSSSSSSPRTQGCISPGYGSGR